MDAERRAAFRGLADDEDYPDDDSLVRHIVDLALDGEQVDWTQYSAPTRRAYEWMDQGDAVHWCQETIRVRARMARLGLA